MPSICLRTVSPRNTLPRATPKRRAMKRATASNRKGSGHDDEDLETPRASTFDVRGGELTPNNPTMTSSIVSDCIDGLESTNLSPNGARDMASELGQGSSTCIGAQSGSRMSRCLVNPIKAKRVRFYRNGDQYFKGINYALHSDKLRSMQPLMEDLARAMGDSQSLPHGIRHIFSIDGQIRITDVDQFEDGESYVCSSNEVFKSLDYANAKEPTWSFTLGRGTRLHDASLLGLCNTEPPTEPTDFVIPKIITVIRNGVKPRRVVRHLLNKRTARSFDQVMTDLTAVVKLDSGAIRKLFDLAGNPVTSLRDFYQDQDVFIAYGNEKQTSDDFYVISEEYKLVSFSHRLRAGAGLMRRRRMPARNESLREDRCGSVIPDELARHLPESLAGQFNVSRLLGDGNTALVYEVTERSTNERMAMKFISKENTIGKESLIESELRLMRDLEHPFIVQMFDSWCIEGSLYLALELVDGGDMFDHLCSVRHFSERDASRLTRCLLNALKYLHDLKIVHRDVKPENLLLYTGPSGLLELKLADFGLATDLVDNEKLYVICGTPTYVAVEVLTETGYDEKVDIWATGVILYVMLCGFPPFQSHDGSQEELFTQIIRGQFSFPSPAWDRISWSVQALILNLITLSPEERLSAKEILDNPWIVNAEEISPEHEMMSEFTVQSRLASEEQVEETEREYFLSRRTSMDELSESGRSIEFSFQRSYS